MPLLETEQGEIFFAQRGDGEPALFLVHGAGATHQHWGLQLRAFLEDAGRVALFDLPGHGRSPGPGRSSVANYSSVLLALLDALEVERAVLAGHSMGGAIALWTALTSPLRVVGLVLVGTGARLPVLPALFEFLEQGNLAEAAQAIVQRAYGSKALPGLRKVGEAAFRQNDPKVFYEDLLACSTYDVMTRLDDIRCPTLIICGDEDGITPPRFSRYLHGHLAGSKLVMVHGAGHMVLMERPDAVNAAVREFLRRLTGGASGQ
ncbi:MAG: alpha/beta hydrolase [Chloroflexaceae bacterium]|nr:alpha/beta hydrolase [Chloroflexaceae bacterium]